MASNDYVFVTRWRVVGTREEVYNILENTEGLTRWWGSVYFSVREIDPGGPGGVGRTVDLQTRGRLPYTLRWQLRVTESRRPEGFSIAASGDFEGTGRWLFRQEGDEVDIHFDWRVRADKPLLRYLSVLFKPLFAANHHWAMARGEEGLTQELVRHRLTSSVAPR